MVPAIGTNQEVNLTAVLLPLNPNFTVFYWWIGQSLQVPLLAQLPASPCPGQSAGRTRPGVGQRGRAWHCAGGWVCMHPFPPTLSIVVHVWSAQDEPAQTLPSPQGKQREHSG